MNLKNRELSTNDEVVASTKAWLWEVQRNIANIENKEHVQANCRQHAKCNTQNLVASQLDWRDIFTTKENFVSPAPLQATVQKR